MLARPTADVAVLNGSHASCTLRARRYRAPCGPRKCLGDVASRLNRQVSGRPPRPPAWIFLVGADGSDHRRRVRLPSRWGPLDPRVASSRREVALRRDRRVSGLGSGHAAIPRGLDHSYEEIASGWLHAMRITVAASEL